jgi:hypothetical protein
MASHPRRPWASISSIHRHAYFLYKWKPNYCKLRWAKFRLHAYTCIYSESLYRKFITVKKELCPKKTYLTETLELKISSNFIILLLQLHKQWKSTTLRCHGCILLL